MYDEETGQKLKYRVAHLNQKPTRWWKREWFMDLDPVKYERVKNERRPHSRGPIHHCAMARQRTVGLKGMKLSQQMESSGQWLFRHRSHLPLLVLGGAVLAFIRWANQALHGIKGASIFVLNLPTVRGLGRFGGFDFRLEDRAGLGYEKLMQARNTLLGAAAGLRQEMHVRVDVLYARLSPRLRAWIDLAGTAIFLIPFCVMMLVTSWPAVSNSWSVREGSPDPGGLARYPIKTVILVCFALLLLQGISLLIRHGAAIAGKIPFEGQTEEEHAAAHAEGI